MFRLYRVSGFSLVSQLLVLPLSLRLPHRPHRSAEGGVRHVPLPWGSYIAFWVRLQGGLCGLALAAGWASLPALLQKYGITRISLLPAPSYACRRGVCRPEALRRLCTLGSPGDL